MDVSLEDVKLYNPQMDGKKFEVPDTKRESFSVLNSMARKKQPVAVVGLRRVGKTVMIKQMMNEYISQGRDVFFFSFDEDRYSNTETLNSVIRLALRIYDDPVIVLDEISRVRNWGGTIKKFYDSQNTRFILSGSASLQITRGKESLAGRLNELYLPPLQYREYMRFNGFSPCLAQLDINEPEKTFVQWKNSGLLEDFILKGGFPELAHEQDRSMIQRYILSNCIDRIIFDDLLQVFNITNPHALYRIFLLVAKDPGMIFVPSSLEAAIGVGRETISRYLFYLERAYVLQSITREASSVAGMRKGRKVYPTTTAISSSFASEPKLAEAAVFDKICNSMGSIPQFYRDDRKREVDFILPSTHIPVEVKYREHISSQEISGLLYYIEKKGLGHGLVVTKNTLDTRLIKGKNIIFVPLEMFLQLEGIKG